MAEPNGIKMRIIALDELMKTLSEVGRNLEDETEKSLLRKLFNAAKTRHEFLSASRSESEE